MAAVNSTQTNKTYYRLIAKAEKCKDNKCIAKIEKVGDKYEQTFFYGGLEGTLISASIKKYEFEGEEKVSFVLELQDRNGVDQLEFSPSFTGYGIINQLASLDLPCEVNISAWIKDGFVKANVKNGSNKVNWKYEPKQIPKVDKIVLPSGKEVKDTTNLQKFWINVFENLKFGDKPKTQIQPTDKSDLVPDPTDDLPF